MRSRPSFIAPSLACLNSGALFSLAAAGASLFSILSTGSQDRSANFGQYTSVIDQAVNGRPSGAARARGAGRR